jgi:hypothetical protein
MIAIFYAITLSKGGYLKVVLKSPLEREFRGVSEIIIIFMSKIKQVLSV